MANQTYSHAVVFDFSPSEQLTGTPGRVITLGGMIGLSDPHAIDRVGPDAPHPIEPMRLRKWSRRNERYALELVSHLHDLISSRHIACLKYNTEEHAIMQIGDAWLARMKDVFGDYRNEFELLIEQNKKGRNRTKLSLTDNDTGQVTTKNILVDDIRILAWITYLVEELDSMLQSTWSAYAGLYVFFDRLPTDGEDLFKLEFLATMIRAKCGDRVSLNTHMKGIVNQRDLIADNITGLAADLFHRPNSAIANAVRTCSEPIFGITGEMVTPRFKPR